MEMRNPFTLGIVGLALALVVSSVAFAQTGQSQPPQATREGSQWKYNPIDRATGSGGPGPKRDLSGTWSGPRAGAGVSDFKGGDKPSLTPFGQQLFGANKPLAKFTPPAPNNPPISSTNPSQ